jgi:hypothetical protein
MILSDILVPGWDCLSSNDGATRIPVLALPSSDIAVLASPRTCKGCASTLILNPIVSITIRKRADVQAGELRESSLIRAFGQGMTQNFPSSVRRILRNIEWNRDASKLNSAACRHHGRRTNIAWMELFPTPPLGTNQFVKAAHCSLQTVFLDEFGFSLPLPMAPDMRYCRRHLDLSVAVRDQPPHK